MLVTELGMAMLVRLEQPSNTRSPMLVTELGRVMLVRLEQYWYFLSVSTQ